LTRMGGCLIAAGPMVCLSHHQGAQRRSDVSFRMSRRAWGMCGIGCVSSALATTDLSM